MNKASIRGNCVRSHQHEGLSVIADSMGPHQSHGSYPRDQLNPMNVDMETMLLSWDITTKQLLIQKLSCEISLGSKNTNRWLYMQHDLCINSKKLIKAHQNTKDIAQTSKNTLVDVYSLLHFYKYFPPDMRLCMQGAHKR